MEDFGLIAKIPRFKILSVFTFNDIFDEILHCQCLACLQQAGVTSLNYPNNSTQLFFNTSESFS
jgi:hypothetical protein